MSALADQTDPTYLGQITERIIKQLVDKPFDAIAIQGVSGAIVGGVVSIALKKPLFVVRKTADFSGPDGCYGGMRLVDSPYHAPCQGAVKNLDYVIVDDFRCTGATAHRIISAMNKERPQTRLVGILHYWGNSLAWIGSPEFEVLTTTGRMDGITWDIKAQARRNDGG